MTKKIVLLCFLVSILSLTLVTGRHFMSPAQRAWAASIASDFVPFSLGSAQAGPVSDTVPPWESALITAARDQIGVTLMYDPAYTSLSYPNGDVPRVKGVCTDVIIRALRDAHGMDLQSLVHMDMKQAFSAYPKNWGLSKPDRNIDHRRVPNLKAYFKRAGASLPISDVPQDYVPGDIVTWVFDNGLRHIGIVSDRMTSNGIPLMIHNVGAGTREQDFLFAYKIDGHFRISPSL